ncbi:TonB-dependent receptor [Acidicapsa ligni]|uniref:TonB-dependent receptor n=1 Tax=Acidicapsa ligni TaxID=542300 RepID=UPI0021E0AA58|nr:carboxypeptidase-like regulatory domain-containing protein [Acidicapsa ligni]
MEKETRTTRNSSLHRQWLKNAWLLSFLTCFFLLTMDGFAQSTASVNGVVRDPAGAAVPNASVKLHNLDTNVDRTTLSNNDGAYVIVSIIPGNYRLEATSSGFDTRQIPSFTLAVGQTATFDFALQVGMQNTVVTVQGATPQLDVTSSNLGTVMATKQVNDLPLNGRNFTQLLELTPGVVPINTGQSNGGGFAGPPAVQGSSFTFPAINGQTNRSNFYLTDGLVNYGSILSTYAVPPIVDAIQEFKIVSHTDSAEAGSVLGGVVNVVTKSGTNSLHGTLWEYIRNDAFDASLPLTQTNPPFRQNQFGASAGGPVVFPKLYNGRNKTFFFGAYQGLRYTQPNDNLLLVPTEAQLSGDESASASNIYNPFSTRPDPANPGRYIRDIFPGKQIPSNLIDPAMVAYAQFVFPKAGATIAGTLDNAIDSTPVVQTQNEWTARVDQTFGASNSAWFRYSFINSTTTQSGGVPGLPSTTAIPARNWGGSYVHTFGPSLIVQIDAAHTTVQHNETTHFATPSTNIFTQVGFSTGFAGSFNAANGGNLLPDPGISGYADGGESVQNTPKATDSTQISGTVTKILGDHELHFGGGYISNSFASPIAYANLGFQAQQTGNPEDSSQVGDSLSSFLLDVPNSANRRNVSETTRPGGVLSAFVQDTWKASPKLTFNIGLRYDLTFIPPYGTDATIGKNGGIETGDMDFSNGTYVLQKLPPSCAQRGFAPCIPGDGTLPAHVVLDPRGKIAHDTFTNFGPRFGFAYRFDEKTVVRGGFGIVYDNWAAISQMAQNIEGSWPDIGQLINNSLNIPSTASATPTATAQNPFAGSTSGLFPAPTPFQQVQWFYDPHIKNAYSEQWTLGIERQLGTSTTIGLNYVGSVSRRNDVGGYYNTALTPGPGDAQARALYPYIAPTFYDRSIGSSNYHAMQFQLNKRFSNGFSYQVAYTWSKDINVGGDGWFGVEGTVPQDPYNPSGFGSRSVSGTDLTNVLSVNTLYQVPVGKGRMFSTGNRLFDYVLGNWQINNIFVAHTGQVFTPVTSSDIANTGNGTTYETLDVIGDPNKITKRTSHEYFNKAAYVTPDAYTYGTAGRNSLRTQNFWELDGSVFRQFPIHDSLSFEFRAEGFNLMNNVVLGTPDANINDGGNFGTVNNTANKPRILQFAGKIIF